MRTILIATMLVALAAVPAAGATDSVTVTLLVDIEGQSALAECDVLVPAGANGRVVLAEAVAIGCIDSYEIREYSFGGFVTCINGLCGIDAPTSVALGFDWPISYWAMSENGQPTTYGVDGFEANAGDVLQFSYTAVPWWALPLA